MLRSLQANGKIEPHAESEASKDDSLKTSCDIESCAFRQDAWDGPIMSCYCEDEGGDWQLASVNLSECSLVLFKFDCSKPFISLKDIEKDVAGFC